MPDGAFDATERQFLELLEAGSGSDVIAVHRHAIAGVPRGERTASRIAEQYSPIDDIRIDPPDVLIVTGSNPLEARIEDEPYWADLVDLLSWASGHVQSMLLSCLSAHAALTIFDGLERVHLASKCTGVFSQSVDTTHPLNLGLEPEIFLPHSRWSTVPLDDLRAAGYQIAIQSDDVGWSVATRAIAGSNAVLVQGHPEYEPSSLLREYRRDAGRYVRRELDDLPCLPFHCVAPQDWEQLETLHQSIVSGRRDEALFDSYPFKEVGERATWAWRSMARRLYANWLSGVT
jgi:homoserine O-succinyltransferase